MKKFFEEFKKRKITPLLVFKFAGILVVGIIAIALLISLIGASFNTLSSGKSIGFPVTGVVTQDSSISYGEDEDFYYEEASVDSASRFTTPTSLPSIPPIGGGTSGNDAEEFEVTEYRATIDSRNISRTCGELTDLKVLTYVVFENANEHDRGCSLTFKVERDRTEEILGVVENLKPKEITQSTRTIKRSIEDIVSQSDILDRKLETIEETLRNAIIAYDNITDIAARAENVEGLSKIIDSRVRMIERLTSESLNISAQLERLEQSKARQLDQLLYTYFYINVYEVKYFDGKAFKDSWRASIQNFVFDVNQIVQNVSVGLVTLLLLILQYVLYLLVILIVIKYGWRFAVTFWKK